MDDPVPYNFDYTKIIEPLNVVLDPDSEPLPELSVEIEFVDWMISEFISFATDDATRASSPDAEIW